MDRPYCQGRPEECCSLKSGYLCTQHTVMIWGLLCGTSLGGQRQQEPDLHVHEAYKHFLRLFGFRLM